MKYKEGHNTRTFLPSCLCHKLRDVILWV